MKKLLFIAFLSQFGKGSSTAGNYSLTPILDDTLAYRYFIVNSAAQRVVIVCRQSALERLPSPLMVTNGGMFDPDFSAHGLLVCDYKVHKQLDSRKAKRANFYVQPNGVFYEDKGKYFVVSTKTYAGLYNGNSPEFATQSGPMLIINDSVNKIFDQHSEYTNIRSGVGILPNGNPVFIIAEAINFYDFASIFKNKFHCKDALFLDGGISEMFIGPDEQAAIQNRQFGPLIAVLRK